MALLLSGAGQSRADLITNGGFETGDFTGWALGPNTFDTYVGPVFSDDILPHSGSFVAELGALNSDETLSQTLTTVPGQEYTLAFFEAVKNSVSGGIPGGNDFSVSLNGTPLLSLTNESAHDYVEHTFTFTGTGSDTVKFASFNNPGLDALDDVSVTPAVSGVPEPTSLTLLGIGALGLLGYGWRRRKQATA